MKTLSLILGISLLALTGCGGPFTAGAFSEPGELTAGSAGDAGASAAPEAEAAGAAGQATSQAGDEGVAGSASGGSSGAGGGGAGGSGGVAPQPLTPACGDEATEISSNYSIGNVPAEASCFRTKTAFNTVRVISCDQGRDVRVNGGASVRCTSEPSSAWLSVCTVKGDFSGADADGYRYIQTSAGQYACGRIFLATEPDGEPCTSAGFEYSKDAVYRASDRVSAACVNGSGACEWRCMSDACSGVVTPRSPKWEIVKSCAL